MSIGNINGATPLKSIQGIKNINNSPNVKKSSEKNFLDSIKEGLDSVKKMQEDADLKVQQALSGNDVEISEVMISSLKAEVSMQLTMQVRNKVVESYKEITRMQI